MNRRKLQRDFVTTLSNEGEELVGVYVVIEPDGFEQEIWLGNFPPDLADKIIGLWNGKDDKLTPRRMIIDDD